MWRRRLGCAWLLVLGACAPIAEARFSDIEVHRPDISIPPASSSAPSSVTFAFAVNSSKLGASAKPEIQDGIVSARVHRLALSARTGITDLSFVQTLHALACLPIKEDSNRCSRQIEIADYVRTSAATSGPTFEVPMPEPVEILPLLRPTSAEQRSILVIVNLGGELPTVPWTADADLSLSIEIRQ